MKKNNCDYSQSLSTKCLSRRIPTKLGEDGSYSRIKSI